MMKSTQDDREQAVLTGTQTTVAGAEYEKMAEKIDGYFGRESAADATTIINVIGVGGVGKTTLLKEIKNLKAGGGIVCAATQALKRATDKLNEVLYVEASTCSTDVEILRLLSGKMKDSRGHFVLEKFELIYACYQAGKSVGFKRNQQPETGDRVKSFIESAVTALGNIKGADTNGDPKELISGILEYLTPDKLLDMASCGANLGLMIVSIVKQLKENKVIAPFLEELRDCNSDYQYRALLKRQFKEELCEWVRDKDRKVVMIIDNYALNYSTNLYYDNSWIGEVLKETGICWIIGSRHEVAYNDTGIQIINMSGFNEGNAKEFLERYLPEEQIKQRKIYEGEAWKNLKRKMLEVCAVSGQGNRKVYLPYMLKMVADYIIRVANERKEVKPTDLIKLREEEFVSYYFFCEMPEMVIAAVQLLSCLYSWTPEEMNLLRARFNYHYLEAEYLLRKCASVERYNDGDIKLHEAIKDAVQGNSGNYIIMDVEEYLFHEMGKILVSNGNMPELRLVKDYFLIAQDYLLRLEETKEDAQIQERVKKEFAEKAEAIYKRYSSASTVSEEFAGVYGAVVENVYQKGNKEKYYKTKLNWADLYTKLYRVDTAVKIEQECKDALLEKRDEYPALLVQAYNWTCQDLSKSWRHDEAAKLGIEGLTFAGEYVSALMAEIRGACEGNTEAKELIDSLELLRKVYAGERFVVGKNSFFPLPNLSDAETYDVDSVKQAFENLNKAIKTSGTDTDKLVQIRKLFADQYIKLRSNQPWYEIRNGKNFSKTVTDPVQYGITTYWIRKAMRDERGTRQSLKNVAAYLFKMASGSEDISRAIVIVKDVLEEILLSGKYDLCNQSEKQRIDEIEEMGEAHGTDESEHEKMLQHCRMLYRMEGISEQTWSIPNEALEPYSYLGDLCLVNGWSREALKKFTIVLLLKYARNSIFSSETLDAYCRCGVALYAEGRSEEGVEFLKNTIKIAESQRIQCPARKLQTYKNVLQRMENTETVEDIVDCLE